MVVFPKRVQISTDRQISMSLLGGNGLGLPMAIDIEVVDVDITVTKSAEKAILQTMSEDNDGHVLVISADSGGCSGYLYDMKIIERPSEEGYQEIMVGGKSILIHNRDSDLLNGIILDFKDTLMGGGFQITNPNASESCGCGQSFG